MRGVCQCCGQKLPVSTDLVVDAESRTLMRAGRIVHLSASAMRTFAALHKYMVTVPNAALDFQAGIPVRRQIFELRKKIAPLGLDIRNVRQRGYRMAFVGRRS